MKYISTGSHDPFYNLAFEEYVLRNIKDDSYLLLWSSEKSIVVGKYQNVFEEVNLVEARKQKVPVLRRISGGGTVYHDRNNLNYSMITDFSRGQFSGYDSFLDPVIQALNKMGVSAAKRRSCDIAVDGMKISGSAQTIKKDRILHHGTLLFNSDLEHLHELLKPSAGTFESKAVKSFRSPVTNILDHLDDRAMTIDDFRDHLLDALFPEGVIQKELEEKDLLEIRRLADEKYSKWLWNYGASPRFTFSREGVLFGMPFTIHLEVKEGEITQSEVHGLEKLLRNRTLMGTRYDYDEVSRILSIDMDQMPVGMSQDDIIRCFF